jgi:hypothetical protein
MNNLALINYYIKSFSIYEALICVASILWIVTLSTTGQTLYGSLISEYVVLILAMLLIIFIIFVSNLNTNVNKPNNINVMLILKTLVMSGPYFLTLGILGFLLFLVINYNGVIISQHVLNTYFVLTQITNLLLMIQIFSIFKLKFIDNNGEFTKSKSLAGFNYLIVLLLVMASRYLYIILNNFVTDG